MATSYSITIQLSVSTIQALANGGFSLYGFKATATSGNPVGVLPTVWFASQDVAQTIVLSWVDQFDAYTSSQSVQPGVKITATSSYPLDLGQLLQVSAGGVGTVVNGSVPSAIEILNASTQQLTCGLAQQIQNNSAAVCAVPLYGQESLLFAPVPKVLLVFASQALSIGETVGRMFSSGCEFDLTMNSNATVAFDINMGWTGANVPTTNIATGASLSSVLIQQTPTLMHALTEA